MLWKTIVLFAVVLTATVSAGSAMAQGASAPAGQEVAVASTKAVPLNKDEDLARMHERFTQFAHTWVAKLNRNHTASRSRMKISKNGDGSYHAKFHQFDGSTIICRVKRTKSAKVPFVGILKYKERIYQSVGDSENECRNGDFEPVRTIAVTEIFNYSNNRWQ